MIRVLLSLSLIIDDDTNEITTFIFRRSSISNQYRLGYDTKFRMQTGYDEAGRKRTNAISHLQTKLFRSSISLIFIFTIHLIDLS